MHKKNQLFMSIRKHILFAFCLLTVITVEAEIIIKDFQSGLPLPKASIFDKNGVFIAVTDDEGIVPENISAASYPLNIRYVGFSPLTVASPNLGVVTMVESTYTLPEITVDDVSRNILYLQAFVREYGTLDNEKDTLAIFKEQIVDYAIPIGKAKYKGWKKPRLLAEREYRNTKIEKKKSHLDTLSYTESFTGNSTNFDISQKFKVPQPILSGELSEYVKDGKYSPEERWFVTQDSYIIEQDELANHKDHYYQPSILKLLGASAAQTRNEARYKFEKGEKAGVSIEKLTEATSNWDMILKGKLFKKITEQNEDTKIAIYSEMFIIDRAYLTAEEAKELKKEKPVIDISGFKVPEGIPEPPEEVIKLKNAVIESTSNSK